MISLSMNKKKSLDDKTALKSKNTCIIFYCG